MVRVDLKDLHSIGKNSEEISEELEQFWEFVREDTAANDTETTDAYVKHKRGKTEGRLEGKMEDKLETKRKDRGILKKIKMDSH